MVIEWGAFFFQKKKKKIEKNRKIYIHIYIWYMVYVIQYISHQLIRGYIKNFQNSHADSFTSMPRLEN
jgi:hypothetical protein